MSQHDNSTMTDVESRVADGPEERDALIGVVFEGKFEIEKVIGVGGMGRVYKARHLRLDKHVALKTLIPELAADETLIRRFEIEAKSAAALTHPNTIRIMDYGKDHGVLFMVMELLNGQSLDGLLRRETKVSPRRTIHIIRQVCNSLYEAHATGMVHRDLKPDNIFLTRSGSDPDYVKVLDFGVAKLKDNKYGNTTLTQAGMIFGTPRYMSPEQAKAQELDARSDIYALGVILYEMLTGSIPFDAPDPVSTLIKHVHEPPPAFAQINPSLSPMPEFENLVMRCLAKDASERYQDCEDLLRALGEVERGLGAFATESMDSIGGAGFATQASPAARGPSATPPAAFDTLGVRGLPDGTRDLGSATMQMGEQTPERAPNRLPVVMAAVLTVLLAVGYGGYRFIQNMDVPAPAAATTNSPAAAAAAAAAASATPAAVSEAGGALRRALQSGASGADAERISVTLKAAGDVAARAQVDGRAGAPLALPATFHFRRGADGKPVEASFLVQADGFPDAKQTLQLTETIEHEVRLARATPRPASDRPFRPGTSAPSAPASPSPGKADDCKGGICNPYGD